MVCGVWTVNRTILELKLLSSRLEFLLLKTVNRTILELKLYPLCIYVRKCYTVNRTILELKQLVAQDKSTGKRC